MVGMLSELIKELTEIQKENGDMNVTLGNYCNSCGEYQIGSIQGIEIVVSDLSDDLEKSLRIQNWVE